MMSLCGVATCYKHVTAPLSKSRGLHVDHSTGIYIYQIDRFHILNKPRLQLREWHYFFIFF
jgi:hypothetical protein